MIGTEQGPRASRLGAGTALLLLALLTACAAGVPPVPMDAFRAGDLDRVRGFYEQQLAEGDPESQALFLNGLANMDLYEGRTADAHQRFQTAGQMMGIWSASTGEVVGAVIGAESSKTWRGDPYEKVMNSFYLGFLYWVRGEPDNARAAFKRGILADAESEEGSAQVDFALMYWLAGRASLAMGKPSDAEDFFTEARTARRFAVEHGARGSTVLPILEEPAKGNLICLIELGIGPRKVAGGHHGSMAMFQARPLQVTGAEVLIDGVSVGTSSLLADIDYQAATRGGRALDGIQEGKAVFKTASGVAGGVLLYEGLRQGGSGGDAAAIAGATLLLLSILTNPTADVRCWEILPQSVHVLTADVAPGPHVLRIEYLTPEGYRLPGLEQEWSIELRETGDSIYLFRSLPGLHRPKRTES